MSLPPSTTAQLPGRVSMTTSNLTAIMATSQDTTALGRTANTQCELCQDVARQSVTRPKKRSCRSTEKTEETEYNIPPAKSSWQPKSTGLWKPVTLTSVRGQCSEGYRQFDVRTVRWSPIDCNNYQFSSLAPSLQKHRETGHITPDDLLTPSESPVPRPSSVYSDGSNPISRPNSVYSDGALSPFHHDSSFCEYSHNRIQANDFRHRSLSVEEKISNIHAFANSGNSGIPENALSNSASAIAGILPGGHMIAPTSPHHRHRPPRCRSQPTLYDRKSGRRRRRDHRPTLNFNKMTEVGWLV